MLVFGIILLLLSTAVNNRRDCSILFSRVTMLILINTIIILYVNINVNFLSDGLILYGGLMTIKNHTLFFSIFILILSTFIVSLSSFFPRKIRSNKSLSSDTNHDNIRFSSLITIVTNKMSDQYRIIEYPLIILFCFIPSNNKLLYKKHTILLLINWCFIICAGIKQIFFNLILRF